MDGDEEEEGVALPRLRKGLHLRTETMVHIDEATARTVLREYGRLVEHLVRRYRLPARRHSAIDHDDMLATGYAVLLQCWVSFDPDRGAKFSSWAAMNLRRALNELVRESHGLPRTVAAQRRLQLADAPPAPPPTPISFEEPHHRGGGERTVGETIADPTAEPLDEACARRHQVAWLRRAIHRHLTERERTVVLLTLDGLEPSAVAAQLDVTRQRIDQLYSRAIEKLQHAAQIAGMLDEPSAPQTAPPARTFPFLEMLRGLGGKRSIAVA